LAPNGIVHVTFLLTSAILETLPIPFTNELQSYMKNKTSVQEADLPKTDPRVKLLAAKIKKEKHQPDALIEILHTAQNSYGYLPMNVLKYISRELHLPPSRVFSTVSFYHFFSLKSKGEHTCLVCTGTACYVKGAQHILNEVEKHFKLKPGEVSADNKLGIQVARCIGACGLAPAVIIDDEVQAKMNPEKIISTIQAKMQTT
jgi:bidirectional [NiFe] hydrogenase diaphorase subunit